MTNGRAKDVCLEEETTAGSYFVSNYPPYSFWSPDRVADAYAALAEELGRQVGGIQVLRRPGKSGIGNAYRAGFRWGLERGYDAFVEKEGLILGDLRTF